MKRLRNLVLWSGFLAVCLVPICLAAFSPYLQWREPIYIASGFAGISALVFLFIQPVLIGNKLPGLARLTTRLIHQWVGGFILIAVIVHVAGLWITSPPDVIDALIFNSPTPFSVWGVIAMWAVVIAAVFAFMKRHMKLRPKTWRLIHLVFAGIIVIGTILHTLLIEGTMEFYSKIALCVFVGVGYLLTLKQAWR